MKMRLDRALRDACPGRSRSDAEKLIRGGRVSVNGRVLRDPAEKIDPEADLLSVDGKPEISRRVRVYLMNKPAGVLSATEDRDCRTVLDLLPPELRPLGLSPAGRLDKDAEGLLLLTNDGELIHRIISPKSQVYKRYLVRLRDPAEPERYDAAFVAGVTIDGGYTCLPAHFAAGERPDEGIVTVCEGKFHQVKRMLAAVGNEVIALKRLSIGGLALDPELPPGGYREVEDVSAVFER